MKKFGIFTLIVCFLVGIGFSMKVYAFHSGGVAECEGCHTMHNSEKGAVVDATNGAPNGGAVGSTPSRFLLRGSDQSSTCLGCHAATTANAGGYHIMTMDVPASYNGTAGLPANYTPAGDFTWLRVGFSWTGDGGPVDEKGQEHGHSIVAVDYSLVADTDFANVPGGGTQTFSPADLTCISCHNPHNKLRYTSAFPGASPNDLTTTGGAIYSSGSYGAVSDAVGGINRTVGVYRFLGGNGYRPASAVIGGDSAFTTNPPIALAPSTYNRIETTSQVRVVYGQGMSEWCANCHQGFLNNAADSSAIHIHPTGANAKFSTGVDGTVIADNYNGYISSQSPTGGSSASSFLSLVPFETGETRAAAITAAKNTNSLASDSGPNTSSNVMCVSCHRAHASGFPFMERWGNDSEMMTTLDVAGNASYFATDAAAGATSASKAMGRTIAAWTAAYYGRTPSNAPDAPGVLKFSPYQHVLCNKCHAKG